MPFSVLHVPPVFVVRHELAHLAAVLQIRRGDDHTLQGQKLPRRQIHDLRAQKNILAGIYQDLVPLDQDRTAVADHFLNAVFFLFQNTFERAPVQMLRHIPAIPLAVWILAFE